MDTKDDKRKLGLKKTKHYSKRNVLEKTRKHENCKLVNNWN